MVECTGLADKPAGLSVVSHCQLTAAIDSGYPSSSSQVTTAWRTLEGTSPITSSDWGACA